MDLARFCIIEFIKRVGEKDKMQGCAEHEMQDSV